MSNETAALPGLDHPKLYSKVQARRRWDRLIGEFKKETKTESAFYIRFERLRECDRDFLAGWFGVGGQWAAYNRLCRFFRIKVG